jgi:glycine cleavage system H protein
MKEKDMNFPADLKYSKTHEWVKDLGNGLYEIGLTDYAQKELGDIVYVNLPQIGDELKAEKAFGDVESVKAVSEIISPINGTVKEINEAIASSPDSINKSPYEFWLIRAEGSVVEALLSAGDYEASLSS